MRLLPTKLSRGLLLWLVALVLLPLVGISLWVHDRLTLYTAEEAMVGAWVQSHDDRVEPVIVEFELRDDRTVVLVNRDRGTGNVTLITLEYQHWQRRGDDIILRRSPAPTRRDSLLWWRPRPPESVDVLRLTPDGPGRYRYVLTRCDIAPVHQGLPPVTGVWTRVEPK